VSWDFHVRMISERYKRESIARERPIAHFVKGVSGRYLINVVGGQLPMAPVLSYQSRFSRTGIIVPMKENEILIVAAQRTRQADRSFRLHHCVGAGRKIE
jgi:hypothetical protein